MIVSICLKRFKVLTNVVYHLDLDPGITRGKNITLKILHNVEEETKKINLPELKLNWNRSGVSLVLVTFALEKFT